MRFTTDEVRELYEQIGGWGHPDFPFLDRNYSTGAYAPCVDLTSIVATWLQEDRLAAVAELWNLLTPSGVAGRTLLQNCLRADLPCGVTVSSMARHEMRAIHLLTMRAAFTCGSQHMSLVAADLAGTTLACRKLAIDENIREALVRAIRPEVKPETLRGAARTEEAERSLAVALSEPPAAAAEHLKVLPPMPRVVVFDYFDRPWGAGTLKYDLFYDHRMYGCGGEFCRLYVDQLGFFVPPCDDAEPPTSVTKEALKDALVTQGISPAKNAKRGQLISEARRYPGLLSALIHQINPERQALAPTWSNAVASWAARVRKCRPVGAALIKLLSK